MKLIDDTVSLPSRIRVKIAEMPAAGRQAWMLHAILCAVVTGWIVYSANTFIFSPEWAGHFSLQSHYQPYTGLIIFWACCLLAPALAAIYEPATVVSFLMLIYGTARYHEPYAFLIYFHVLEIHCVLSLLGLGVAMLAKGERPRFPRDPVSILMLALMAWVVVSMIGVRIEGIHTNPDPYHSPSSYFQIFALFVLAAATLRGRADALVVGLFLPVLLALRYKWSDELGNGIWRDNDMACILVVVFPLAIIPLFDRKSYLVLKLAGLYLAYRMLEMVSKTENRAAGLAVVATLPVLWLVSRKKWLWLGLAMPAIVVSIVMFKNTQYYERYKTTLDQGADSGLERLEVWKAAWAMARAHPVFGVGPGNFANFVHEFSRQENLGNVDSHNSFLNMLCELGWPGGALYALLFLTAMGMLARTIWRAGPEHPGPAAKAVLSAIVAYLMAAEFLTRHDMVLAYALAGWAVALHRVEPARRIPPAAPPPPAQEPPAEPAAPGPVTFEPIKRVQRTRIY